MKLAVSDTGFDQLEDVDIELQNSVYYLEIVPTKIKPYKDLTLDDLLKYKSKINSLGLAPYSLLSLFYTLDIDDVSKVDLIKEHLYYLNCVMVELNCDLMVFGSPGLRKKIPGWETYIDEILFFIDKALSISGKYLIIEPVASHYGAEFFNTVEEIVTYLDTKKFTNIFTMIDTHNSFLEKTNPIEEYKRFKNYIKHIHVAEVGLGQLKNKSFHKKFAKVLEDYEFVVTHEIRDRENFKKSLKTFKEIYG